MNETLTKIATYTSTGSEYLVTFSNIPQIYTDLKVVVSVRNTGGTYGGALVALNLTTGLTGYAGGNNNHYARKIDSSGYGAGGLNYGTTLDIMSHNSPNYTAQIFSNWELYLPNYTSNYQKSYVFDGVTENGANEAYARYGVGYYTLTSPITSITFGDNTSGDKDLVAQHSTYTLYGIKNYTTTLGNSIKATGGSISFDGTYVTHTFNTSGSFTPTQPILADYLVVAGGGGGGGGNGGGGGGGAGGYRSFTSQSLSSGTSYTCTVGAGGTGGASRAYGTKGSDTIAFGITSSGGGQGGYFDGIVGTSGGSGGGGGSKSSGTTSGGAGNAGSYSPVEGYAGGSGNTASGYAGGGGGGATAVGGNATTTTAGVGGAGGNWLSIGNYYAGGGGGGSNSTGTPSSGGVGGGGNGTNQTTAAGGTPGLANTGGGGGGGGDNGSGNAGGSGIVIIRYKG
jgi:hypothetical protein